MKGEDMSLKKEYRLDMDFRFTLDYDYDVYRDCEANGCDMICRCGVIENVVILGVDCEPTLTIKENSGKNGAWVNFLLSKHPIVEYCIERLYVINGIYDKSNYEVETCSGYYGEEICDVDFFNSDALKNDIMEIIRCPSDAERIKYVLMKEYSFIADFIKNVTSVDIVAIPLKDIKHHLFDTGFVKKDKTKYFKEIDLRKPIGLLSKDNVLVDGNNRLLETLSRYKDTKKVKMVKLYE